MVTTGPAIVLFVVGVLLVAGSGFALFRYEGGPGAAFGGGAAVYSVKWVKGTHDALSVPAAANPATIPVKFTIDAANVVSVKIVVDCTDTNPVSSQAPVTVHVELTGPGIAKQSKDGTCGGKLTLEISLPNVEPSPTTVSASSAADAERQAAAAHNDTKGEGAWSGGVTFTSPAPVTPPIGLPVGGYSAGVTAAFDHYDPHASPVVK